MASIDYCILTMKIMEIYHKCSLDKIPKYGNGKAFGLFPYIYQEQIQNVYTFSMPHI
jgi:hypothetical protein